MLHVVFGAGQVGKDLALLLQSQGHQVKVVRRSPAPVAPGIEVVSGDAMDTSFAVRVAQGAAVIYHCMNPSAYSKEAWSTEFPKLGEALIHAAVVHDARLVCLDNLYGYGPTAEPRTEDTPMRATGPKGLVRIAWDHRLHEAAREQGLRFVVGRAGDFFGPGTNMGALLSTQMVEGLAKGKAAWLIGDSTVPHAFSFVPDVVAGLLALGNAAKDVEGKVFHLPVLEVAPRVLVAQLARALGVQARVHTAPPWAVAAMGPFVPLLKEIRETLYQWDRPFLVSDARFRARFPGLATSLEEAVTRTAAETKRHRPAA